MDDYKNNAQAQKRNSNKLIGLLSGNQIQSLCHSKPGFPFAPRSDHDLLDAEHGIDLHHLTTLSRLLMHTISAGLRLLGSNILFSASAAGSPSATFHLIQIAVRNDQLGFSQIRPVRESLARLAKEKNVVAMSLQGQIFQAEGNIAAALDIYEEATKLASEADARGEDLKHSLYAEKAALFGPPRAEDSPVIMAWNELGNILANVHGDLEGAARAFEVGALKHDDPESYYYLALLQEHLPNEHGQLVRYSSKWLLYHSKAAASGHVEACYELGKFYSLSDAEIASDVDDPHTLAELSRIWHSAPLTRRLQAFLHVRNHKLPMSPQTYDRIRWLAYDWFSAALVDSHHAPSQFEMAKITWRTGEVELAFDTMRMLAQGGQDERQIYKQSHPMVVEAAKMKLNEWYADVASGKARMPDIDH